MLNHLNYALIGIFLISPLLWITVVWPLKGRTIIFIFIEVAKIENERSYVVVLGRPQADKVN